MFSTFVSTTLYLPLSASDTAHYHAVVDLLDDTPILLPEARERVLDDTKRGFATSFHETVLVDFPDDIERVDVVGTEDLMLAIRFAPEEVAA